MNEDQMIEAYRTLLKKISEERNAYECALISLGKYDEVKQLQDMMQDRIPTPADIINIFVVGK